LAQPFLQRTTIPETGIEPPLLFADHKSVSDNGWFATCTLNMKQTRASVAPIMVVAVMLFKLLIFFGLCGEKV
jgi:hypothetical protein